MYMTPDVGTHTLALLQTASTRKHLLTLVPRATCLSPDPTSPTLCNRAKSWNQMECRQNKWLCGRSRHLSSWPSSLPSYTCSCGWLQTNMGNSTTGQISVRGKFVSQINEHPPVPHWTDVSLSGLLPSVLARPSHWFQPGWNTSCWQVLILKMAFSILYATDVSWRSHSVRRLTATRAET